MKMNAHQIQAHKLMNDITCELIGGYENTMEDFDKDSEEYIEASNFLNTPKQFPKYPSR